MRRQVVDASRNVLRPARQGMAYPMWILIITFISYGDPGSLRDASFHVESIEFTTGEKCESAKAAYLTAYLPVTANVNKAIEEERSAGQLRGPNGFDIQAICVSK